MGDGDRFYVFVVANPGASLDKETIGAEIGRRFGAAPRGVVFGTRAEILRTTSGKPMRQAMLAQLREQGLA
jgi:hypothetical protein